MPQHRRLLRNYLIDARLQLRYTLIMVAISTLLVGVLGWVWYDQVQETSKIVEVKALASMTDAEVQQIQQSMAWNDQLRLWMLVGLGVVFALIVAGYGIMLTHKIAGPLFKISRHTMDIRDGRLEPIFDLRRGDQLREYFDTFKEMHGALRQRAEHDVEVLDTFIEGIERQLGSMTLDVREETQMLLDDLRTLREQKAQSLLPQQRPAEE